MNGKNTKFDKFSHTRRLQNDAYRKRNRFTADLYVPFELYSYTLSRIRKNKNLSIYLERLLKNYNIEILKNTKPYKYERTSYQSKFQHLKRLSFRPQSQDWAELRSVSRYLGISMCKAFVLLLELERRNTQENGNLSKKRSNPRCYRIINLIQKISPKKDQIVFELIVDW
ncbi:DUF1564 family protein [Leptospira sp. WS92.C1]